MKDLKKKRARITKYKEASKEILASIHNKVKSSIVSQNLQRRIEKRYGLCKELDKVFRVIKFGVGIVMKSEKT